MTKKRKYLSEFAVNLYSARWQLITAEQLTSGGKMRPEELRIANSCHIYLICQRPGLTYVPETFSYIDGIISGDLAYRISGAKKTVHFQRRFDLLDGATRVKLSEYPQREILALNDKGERVRYLPASMLSITLGQHFSCKDISMLDVLYVGQSFASGNRSAFDRLRSHSTLQKILAEASYKSPDNEIFVATFEYLPYRVISSIDGRSAEAISDYSDTKRFTSIREKPLKKSQQVSLIEAALIRYFRPHYNTIYKKKFPSNTHKVLRSCYELDFSELVVEINTEDLRFYLHSDHVTPSMHHISNIELVSENDRAGLFYFTDNEGKNTSVINAIK
jgi:hypothetical protein